MIFAKSYSKLFYLFIVIYLYSMFAHTLSLKFTSIT